MIVWPGAVLLAVRFHVMPCRVFCVLGGMCVMTVRQMRVVRRLVVIARVMVLCRFGMVMGCHAVMVGRLTVFVRCLL